MKVYVASSWRNSLQPDIVELLRLAGHEVYDFRNPLGGETGFHWSDIDPAWQSWTVAEYVAGLEHPHAVAGFGNDFAGMEWAEVCVLLLPCGRSAHLEAGWFVGAGKPLVILVDRMEPELMYKMASLVTGEPNEVLAFLDADSQLPQRAGG